jgi:hypothetical protein
VSRGIFIISRGCVILLEVGVGINFVLWDKYRSKFVDGLRFKGRNLDRPFRFAILTF